ncbi:MAG: hypothetical protein ATN34_04510 [Epulopiscium sp. Nele67-Bin002]|nr:MAG: hypothetical protein BEN18_00500 [Epulopiscium sp. Nuni2H_MBin001]OON90742.1 MAG: hypothetical protein ATN33_02325 [Epulopiscium sp. Nele67-Bin001]OON91831.1 MAG: hypothetical protein ATN34_04510 [Epulopiscium sp. Nele67-Bin002]
MSSWIIWILVIVAVLVGLSFWGRKLQKRYDEHQTLIDQHKQSMQIFVIDKKKDTVDNLKLPKFIKEQIPAKQKKKKMPIVIAKIGPQVQTLLCDESIYNSIPVKKNVKVEIAGVLIVGITSGKLPEPEKKGFRQKLLDKANGLKKQNEDLKKAK